MFALSQGIYLFEANLNLLANTSTPDVVQVQLKSKTSLPAAFVIGPEIPMQYYTSTEMYSDKCMENQVCNNCTYRQNSISDVLSEDVKLSIYFSFKILNTL